MTGVVVVSAGHNPEDRGAEFNGVSEFDYTLPWRDALVDELDAIGLIGVAAPVGTLKDKVRWINQSIQADLCIEIHFNACGNCGAKGAETLYCPGSAKGSRAAKTVHTSLILRTGLKDRGYKEGWYRMDRPGVEDYPGDAEGDEKPDYFLHATRWPALIIEPEFIHNPDKIGAIMTDAIRAIAAGCEKYING